MKCDEIKLFLYADGQSPESDRREIEDHLSQCNKCRMKLDRMQFTIKCFTSYYKEGGRVACPLPEELASYQEGVIGDRKSSKIKAHIAECPLCRDELRLLKTCDEQNDGVLSTHSSPPLSKEVLKRIKELGQDNLRKRMGHVVKTLLDKGKENLTQEHIDNVLDRFFQQYPEPVPVHALPEVAAQFDTELTLRESAFYDITLNVGHYVVSLRLVEDILTIKALKDGVGVSDVEVTIMTRTLGARKASTGRDGIAVVAGIMQGPCQVSVKVPDEYKK